MPHLFSNSAKASRSCCRTAQSLWSYIGLYTMQSSANKRVLDMILSGRSLMNSMNIKGPSTEPKTTMSVCTPLSNVEDKSCRRVSQLLLAQKSMLAVGENCCTCPHAL